MKLTSKPLKNANAIEVAAFAVVFHEPLDGATLDGIAAACEELNDELPGIDRPQGMEFSIGNNMATSFGVKELPKGVTRFRVKTDGTQEWRLQAVENTLLVTCFDYTSWSEVWAKVKRYLNIMISAIHTPKHMIEVGFQVVDKFVSLEGEDLGTYSLDDIFSEDCPYLTNQVRQSGRSWHVFQGWFEPAEGYEPSIARVLHQLNLSTVEEKLTQSRLSTTIDHRGAVRFEPGRTLLQALSPQQADEDIPTLEKIFEQLRTGNQKIIKQLLNIEKIQSIGMDV